MAENPLTTPEQSPETTRSSTKTVRLPGFIREDAEIGLGDVIKRTTSYLGIKPCGGCEQRAAALNRWIVFSRKRSE